MFDVEPAEPLDPGTGMIDPPCNCIHGEPCECGPSAPTTATPGLPVSTATAFGITLPPAGTPAATPATPTPQTAAPSPAPAGDATVFGLPPLAVLGIAAAGLWLLSSSSGSTSRKRY